MVLKKEVVVMAHCTKYTKVSCGHMFEHFDRSVKHMHHESIDQTKTYLNYNLAVHQKMNQSDFLKKRCSEVRCQNRKDVNVMVSWIVTVPKDLPQQFEQEFFEITYDFLEQRYGRDNVISAYVHKDEVTPHMHFAFVPVIKDKKREGYKISAKEVVNRYDLQTFHQDLSQYLEQHFGFEVSILNQATREGNKSIRQLKMQSATEQIAEAAQKAAEIVFKAQEQVKGIEVEYQAKKAYVRAYSASSKVSAMYPNYAVTKRSIFGKETVTVPKKKWEEKYISANEKNYLLQATKEFERSIEEFKMTISAKNLESLENQVKKLKNENLSLERENFELKSIIQKERQTVEKVIDKINAILNKLPEDMATSFVQAWETYDQQQSKQEQELN